MTKSKFLFTAILATMISAGAWAYAPGSEPNGVVADPTTGAHDVYEDAPTDAEASAGIAGVTYVNRVANRAGAAAQAAEDHAAHASASASAAQSSADAAAAAAANAGTILNGITAAEGIVVTDKTDDDGNVDGKEIAVKRATETELGGLFAPASEEELQATAEKMGELGLNISDPNDQAMVAITYPLAMEIASQGLLSVAYATIQDANADYNADNTSAMRMRPLSTMAHMEGMAVERSNIRAESNVSYVNMPGGQKAEVTNHAVGDAARPVYVADTVTLGKHSGVVTAIESVAVPVGANNFTGATSTAKIWIQ